MTIRGASFACLFLLTTSRLALLVRFFYSRTDMVSGTYGGVITKPNLRVGGVQLIV